MHLHSTTPGNSLFKLQKLVVQRIKTDLLTDMALFNIRVKMEICCHKLKPKVILAHNRSKTHIFTNINCSQWIQVKTTIIVLKMVWNMRGDSRPTTWRVTRRSDSDFPTVLLWRTSTSQISIRKSRRCLNNQGNKQPSRGFLIPILSLIHLWRDLMCSRQRHSQLRIQIQSKKDSKKGSQASPELSSRTSTTEWWQPKVITKWHTSNTWTIRSRNTTLPSKRKSKSTKTWSWSASKWKRRNCWKSLSSIDPRPHLFMNTRNTLASICSQTSTRNYSSS